MATISFTLTTAELTKFINVFGQIFDYDGFIEALPNGKLPDGSDPPTRGEYIRQQIIRELRLRFRRFKKRQKVDAIVDENVEIT